MKSLAAILFTVSLAVTLAHPGARIIGGNPSTPLDHPYAAAIYLQRSDGQYFCGGAILAGQWIVTAAQCVEGATTFTIQLGSTILNGEDPNRQIVATVNSVIHPNYDPISHDNDLALLRLHLNVTFNEFIRPVNLPSITLPSNVAVEAIGWGQTGDWGTGVVNTLNEVRLVTISNEECQLTYGDQIKDSMVCVNGNYEEGTCTGDNGSPLIVLDSQGQHSLVGINIFRNQESCETIAPSGYVRIFEEVEWLRSLMGI